MIESVPLIQNANDAQQINASIIAMKKASKELDEKILKLNNLNKELDKKIAVLDNGLAQEITDRENADSAEVTNRNTAITNAVNALDVASVGGSGKYISAISETDGKISATVSDLTSVIESGNNQPATSGGVYQQIAGQIYTSGDFNNFKTVGTYQFSDASVTNVPVEALASNLLYGTLEVLYWGNNNVIQRLTSTVEGVIAVYIRRYSNFYGSWGHWFKQRNASSTILENGTDLNGVDTIGIYGLDGSYTNLPQNVNGSGILVVDNYPPNFNSFAQTLTLFLNGKAFVYVRRKYDGGTWGTWFPLTMNWTTVETVAGTFGENNDVVYKITLVTTLPETTTGTIAYKLIDLGVSIDKIIKFEGAVTNRSGNQWQYPIPAVTESGYKITCQLYQGKLRIGTDWHDVATGEARITIYYTK